MVKESGCAGSQLSSRSSWRLSPHRSSFNSSDMFGMVKESGCAGSQQLSSSSNSSEVFAVLDAVCGSMQAVRASGSVVQSSGPVGRMGSSVSESIYGRLPTLTSLTARTSLSHGGSHQAAQAQHSGQLNYLSIRIIHLRAFSRRGSGFGKCEANELLKWIYFSSPPAGDRVYSRRQGPDFTSGGQFFLTDRELSDLQCDLDMERKVFYTNAGGFI